MVIRNRKYINNDDLAVRLLHRVVLLVPDSATSSLGFLRRRKKRNARRKTFRSTQLAEDVATGIRTQATLVGLESPHLFTSLHY